MKGIREKGRGESELAKTRLLTTFFAIFSWYYIGVFGYKGSASFEILATECMVHYCGCIVASFMFFITAERALEIKGKALGRSESEANGKQCSNW